MKMTLPEGPIRLVGLTGSIGTGKSTAAGFFRELGAPVIDADELARSVVRPGQPAVARIGEAFGPGVLDSTGGIDRAALASLVFVDKAKRHMLEGLLHPLIAEEAAKRQSELLEDAPAGFVVYDIPLLFETGQEGRFDLIVTVAAERELQVKRVTGRSGLTPDEVARRLAAQIDVAEKSARSHAVLDNSTTPEALKSQVERLVRAIVAHNSRRTAG